MVYDDVGMWYMVVMGCGIWWCWDVVYDGVGMWYMMVLVCGIWWC